MNVFCLSSPCKQSAYIVFVCIKGLVLIACAIILHRITSSSLSALLYLQAIVSLLVCLISLVTLARATLMSSCCREDGLRNPLPKARKNMFLSQIQELAVHASLRKIQQGTSKNRTVIENRPAKSVQRISSSSP